MVGIEPHRRVELAAPDHLHAQAGSCAGRDEPRRVGDQPEANPGEIPVGIQSLGSRVHLAMLQIQNQTGTQFELVSWSRARTAIEHEVGRRGCRPLVEQPRLVQRRRQGNIAPQRRFSSCLGGSSMPNPWMSMWLSAANAWAGAARSFWTAEMRRQQTAMVNEMTRQMMRFWTGAWVQPSSDAKTRRRR